MSHIMHACDKCNEVYKSATEADSCEVEDRERESLVQKLNGKLFLDGSCFELDYRVLSHLFRVKEAALVFSGFSLRLELTLSSLDVNNSRVSDLQTKRVSVDFVNKSIFDKEMPQILSGAASLTVEHGGALRALDPGRKGDQVFKLVEQLRSFLRLPNSNG